MIVLLVKDGTKVIKTERLNIILAIIFLILAKILKILARI